MIETILIARDRKTGKDVLLAGREFQFRQQLEQYKKLCGAVNEDFSNVVLAQVQPHKKPLKLITKADKDARDKAHAESVAAAEKQAKAEADAAKKSPAKKKNAADKTENQTGTDAGTKSE